MVEAPVLKTGGELLLEVRAEEIPARMLEPAVKELATRLFEELVARSLAPREVETGFTPRRLLIVLQGLPQREPDSEERVVGPPVRAAYAADGSPTPALTGFARRCGVEPQALERIATDKGEYLSHLQRRVGKSTAEVLSEVVPRLVAGLSWPKTMVWGDGHGPWARPVHGLVALLDGEVVPMTLFGIESGRATRGHPVLSPEPFEVAGAADYRARLAARGIVPSPGERRKALLAAMHEAAGALGGRLVDDPPLASKLAAICEIPGLVQGSFDEGFLELPREVLVTSLRDHQSAFTVEKDGALLPAFLTVMDRPDDPIGRVRAGNEWVVAARLADARFFFHEDGKRAFVERRPALEHLTFHAQLGSYAAKAARVEKLSGWLCDALGWGELTAAAEEAARLLKVDLASEMVKEFTSLQGVVGGLYARAQGHSEEVWQAIYDQYLPASMEDPLPRGRVGQVVGLADRIDTIVGMFGLGLVPSGSRDPFGLRRAAQGVVRICIEGGLPLDLDAAAREVGTLYEGKLKVAVEKMAATLRSFLDDRIRFVLGTRGYAYDEIEAALAAGTEDLPDLERRVEALHRVREGKDFLSLVLAAKRIANIVKDAPRETLVESALAEPAERALYAAFRRVEAEVERAAEQGEHERCLERTAELAGDLDRFFVEVMVMVDDELLRRNRIALLQAIERVANRVARLTEMVVDRAEHRAKHGS